MAKRSKKSVRIYRTSASILVLFLFAFVFLYNGVPFFGHDVYENRAKQPAAVIATSTVPVIPVRQATHVPTPAAVKGIYMTSCVAATPSFRDKLIKLMDETEINTVVIDAKSYDGHLTFEPKSEDLKPAAGGGCFVKGMQDLIDELHEHHIYVAMRVASFQDQYMVKRHPEWAVKKASATSTVWTDYKGISWIDASVRPFWSYLVAIAREAHDIGADEINFDYIRFPADGNMKDIYFPWSGDRKKSDVIRDFYEYLHSELAPDGIVISGDIFGMTTTNTDDLNIGQLLENALPNFDYVAPMVYPSHYPNGFFGLGDPNKHVYEVVKISADHAVARAIATTTVVALPDARIGTSTPALYSKPSYDPHKIRPWLQDNDYPVPYTPEMVRAQINAAYDAGLNSWMLWDAGNTYTRSALLPE